MRASRVYRSLLLAVIVWGALAFGSPYPWAYWPLAGACAALGLWAIAASGVWRRWPPSPLAAALSAVGLAIAVQMIPLPYSWFSTLTPGADRFFTNYQLGYQLHLPESHALSLSPSHTLTSLMLFTAFALFLVGLTQAYRHIRLEWLATRLIGFGVVMAVFGAVQKSFNYEGHHALIYGFWERSSDVNSFGPFLNRNHFAGWMVLVLPLAIAYACAVLEMSRKPRGSDFVRWTRWLTTPDASRFLLMVVCVLAMGTALVITGSRSGIASFGVASLALGWFLSQRLGGRKGRAVAIAFLAILFVGAIAWAGAGSTIQRFAAAGGDASERVNAWRDALRIFQDFPVFGVGLNSFGLAMLVYQTGARDAIYMQAHNDYVQLLTEGGLLVAIPALVTIGVLLSRLRRRLVAGTDDVMAYWMRAGAVAGLVGIAAQSMVEFSLQMPGITALFVTMLALALHRQPDELTRYSQSRGRPIKTA